MEEAIPYEAKRIWQSFKDRIPWENYVQFPDYAAFIDYLDTLDRLEDFLRDQVTKYFESIQVNNDSAEEAKPTEELRISELHELVGDFRKLFEAFNEVNHAKRLNVCRPRTSTAKRAKNFSHAIQVATSSPA